jgi:TP901 family phage tail tape measure protein
MATIGTAWLRIMGDVSHLRASLLTAQTSLTALSGTAQTTSKQMQIAMYTAGSAVGVLGAALVGNIIKIGAEFEYSLRRVATITSATDAEERKLAETARKIGESTAFTAREVADGMVLLAQAGLGVSNTMGVVEHAVKLAGSQGADLATTTHLMASTMRAFNLEASEAQRITDVFAVACNNSFFTVEKLNDALKYAGPMAKVFGLSIEETTALMMDFVNLGIDASQAGTTLRGGLTLLTKAVQENTTRFKQQKEILSGLGLTLNEVNPELVKLPEIIKKFGQTSLSAGDAMILFGQRAGGVFANLIQASREGRLEYDKFLEKLINGAGTTEKMYAKQMDTVSKQWIIAVSKMQEWALKLFDIINPELMALINSIQRFFDTLNSGSFVTNVVGAALEAIILTLYSFSEILQYVINLLDIFISLLMFDLPRAQKAFDNYLEQKSIKLLKGQAAANNLVIKSLQTKTETIYGEIAAIEEQISALEKQGYAWGINIKTIEQLEKKKLELIGKLGEEQSRRTRKLIDDMINSYKTVADTYKLVLKDMGFDFDLFVTNIKIKLKETNRAKNWVPNPEELKKLMEDSQKNAEEWSTLRKNLSETENKEKLEIEKNTLEEAENLHRQFYNNLVGIVDGFLTDAFAGRLKTFGDYWRSFWENLKAMFIQQFAKAIVASMLGMTTTASGLWGSFGAFANGILTSIGITSKTVHTSVAADAAATSASASASYSAMGASATAANAATASSFAAMLPEIAAVAAAIVALYLLIENFDKISDWVSDKVNELKESVENPVGWIEKQVSGFGDKTKDFFSAPLDWATDPVKKAGSFFKNFSPFASGGIVTQPTRALIGEGGQSEAVLPLDTFFTKMNSMLDKKFQQKSGAGTTIIFNINGAVVNDESFWKRITRNHIIPQLEQNSKRGVVSYVQ